MSASTMTSFVKKLFSDANPSTLDELTQRKIRVLYMKEEKLKELSQDDKMLLKDIVLQFLEEFSARKEQTSSQDEGASEGNTTDYEVALLTTQSSDKENDTESSSVSSPVKAPSTKPGVKKKKNARNDIGSSSTTKTISISTNEKASKSADEKPKSESPVPVPVTDIPIGKGRKKKKTLSAEEVKQKLEETPSEAESDSESVQEYNVTMLPSTEQSDSDFSPVKNVKKKQSKPVFESDSDFSPVKTAMRPPIPKVIISPIGVSRSGRILKSTGKTWKIVKSKPRKKRKVSASESDDSPIKKPAKKRKQKAAKFDSPAEDSDSDDGMSLADVKRKEALNSSGASIDESIDNGEQESADEEEDAHTKIGDSESDFSPIKIIRKKKRKLDNSGSEAEDHDLSFLEEKLEKKKRKKKTGATKAKPKKTTTTKATDPTKTPAVLNLEKIARSAGIMPVGKKYGQMFGQCETALERIQILEDMLREAGMSGRPTLEKAEELKLQREASELNKEAIIESKGRPRRNVFSVFSRHKTSTDSPDEKPESPAIDTFNGISDLVDSEGSD